MSQPPLDHETARAAKQAKPSGIPLFKLFGIQVYLHSSWFIIAVLDVYIRQGTYGSILWNIAELLTLFGIVLIHEFGHALACISVGGKANRIMLWPLGGVAFVSPPQRPGAVLWSIAAGPLVNVLLVPVTIAMLYITGTEPFISPLLLDDPHKFVQMVFVINLVLLFFNMLPIYPLDGGQILRAILWFIIGQGRSLMVASIIGLVGAGLGFMVALATQNFFLILIAAFAGLQSWAGFQQSKALMMLYDTPRRTYLHCPHCGGIPPVGPLWLCTCGKPFDTFESFARCPHCGQTHTMTACPLCGQVSPPMMWYPPATTTVTAGEPYQTPGGGAG